MHKRSIKNIKGRKGNVRPKAYRPMAPGRSACRMKRWVSRIWLDTVLAVERKGLLLTYIQVPTYASTKIDEFLSERSGIFSSEKVHLE